MSTAHEKFAPIKVYARHRPVSTIQVDPRQDISIQLIQPHKLLARSGFNERRYTFDYVFGEDASNLEVYNRVVAPMINNVLEGFNCTVIAYGQSGSGKTHTILGELDRSGNEGLDHALEHNFGLVPRAASQLLAELSKSSLKVDYTLRVSFIEIYNEEIRDLLGESNNLRLYDDPVNKGSICIKDITKTTICNAKTFAEWLKVGLMEYEKQLDKTRYLSSFSALLFAFYVDIREVNSKGDEIIKTGQLHLIDLPASEYGNPEYKNRENATLGRGLSTLNLVVKALAQKAQHVPYRDSKLTRILQNSLGGNCKTAIIATYWPSPITWTETLSTLDFAHSAKTIKNTPQVNLNRKPANLFSELQEEVNKLRSELSAARSGQGFYVTQETYNHLKMQTENSNKEIIDLVKKIKNLEEFLRAQDSQYHDLEKSFKQTREYLENVRIQLAEREQAVLAGCENISALNTKQDNLYDTANTLLGVCKTVTELEQTYYDKYQAKCRANQRNIDIAKQMVNLAVECLNEGLRFAREGGLERNTLISTMEVACEHLQEEQIRSVSEIRTLPIEMRDKAQIPLPCELVPSTSSHSYAVSTFANFCESHYKQQRAASAIGTDAMTCMKAVATHAGEVISDIRSDSEEMVQAVDKVHKTREEARTNCLDQLTNVLNTVDTADQHVSDYLLDCGQALAEDRARYEARCAEEIALLEAPELLTKLILDVSDLLNYETCDELKETIIFNSEMPQQVSQHFTGSLRALSMDVHNRGSKFFRDLGASTKNMHKYSETVVYEMDGTVNQLNANLEQEASYWTNRLKNATNLISSVESVNTMKGVCKSIEASNKNHTETMQQVLQNALEEVEDLQQDIESTGHAGDTPARQTYSYPKEF